jgi:hypothetical protein
MIKPTVGCIVLYTPRKYDVEHYGVSQMDPDQPLAASIVYVWNERMVNLDVSDHQGGHHPVDRVTLLQDDDVVPVGERYAEWMPHQKGQAGSTGTRKTTREAREMAARLVSLEARTMAEYLREVDEVAQYIEHGAKAPT